MIKPIYVIERDRSIRTLGQIPFLLYRLGQRLHARGLVGNPKFAVYLPEHKVQRPESEQ